MDTDKNEENNFLVFFDLQTVNCFPFAKRFFRMAESVFIRVHPWLN